MTLLNQVRDGVPYYMIIPLILVLVTAFMGYQTFICLFLGIGSAYILGRFAGTVTDTNSFINDLIMTGFADAGIMGCGNDDVGSSIWWNYENDGCL